MLLLVGNQGMYQKFFSARSEKDAQYAVFGWIAGTLVLETLLITFAVIGQREIPDGPAAGDHRADGATGIADAGRRDPFGRHFRQSDFDGQ